MRTRDYNLILTGFFLPLVGANPVGLKSFAIVHWYSTEEGGFMSKTENGCSIDGWDGVQVQ